MISRVLLGALVALALTVATAPPARAAGEIALSLDGRTWHQHLTTPLFDPGFRWVPGDQQERTFWVRNQGPTAAFLQIQLQTADPDALLANGDIELSVRDRSGDWVRLASTSPSVVSGPAPIARDGVARFSVRAAFRPDSTNRTQNDRLALTFEIQLTQAGGASGPESAGLPDTGAAVSGWMIWLAAILLGSGGALVRPRQRGVRHG